MVSAGGSDEWLGVVLGGKYRFLKELGAGGMGRVFLAVDDTIDRKVAIKVLHQELASDEAVRRRFETEAKAIARLHHPNCVMLYEFGFAEELDALYAVFEYVEGFSLESLVGEQLPLRDILTAGIQVARAIDHAHSNQIIHRDLKPENIMVVGDDQELTIKVLDFGIARIAENDEKRTRLTQMGQMFGTPPYMSPEQARAKLDVTYSTDIYAIGVILYEMAEGRLPFMGDTPIETVMMHLHDDIPPMEREDLPTDLEGIILTCLQKEADARFDSCEALARALESVSDTGEDEGSVLTDRLKAVGEDEDIDDEEKQSIATANTLLAHQSEEEICDDRGEDSPDEASRESDEAEEVTAPSLVDSQPEDDTVEQDDDPQAVAGEDEWDDDLAMETMVPGMGGKKKAMVALLLVVLLGGAAGVLLWERGEDDQEMDRLAEVEEDDGPQGEVTQELEEPPEDPLGLDEDVDAGIAEEIDEESQDESTEEGDGLEVADEGDEEAVDESVDQPVEQAPLIEEEPTPIEASEEEEDSAEEPEQESEQEPEEEPEPEDEEVDSESPEGIQLPGDDGNGSLGQPEGIGLPPQD